MSDDDPFAVLGVAVTATTREIEREAQKLLGMLELGFAEGRTRDVWRRLRFVIDQAREWALALHTDALLVVLGDLRGTLDGVPLTARARADRTRAGTRIAATWKSTTVAGSDGLLILST